MLIALLAAALVQGGAVPDRPVQDRPVQDRPVQDRGAPDDAVPDVVVTGHVQRGSAIAQVEPIAVLDDAALRALGAATMKEVLARLKGVATSTSGAEPVLLLNGRRVSGPEEVYGLPPEAIERTEILPEEEAPRFGFPATVRIMNFVTKAHFRATSALQLAGTTTEGRGGTSYSDLNATRIDGDRRTSLHVACFRQEAVSQADRGIVPDPVARKLF